MLKKIISIVFILALLCINVFAGTAVIENSGESRYKSIRLTPEIYNNANSNLSDLRIKDNNGEDVPYFVNSNEGASAKDTAVYPMRLIDSYTKDDAFYFDYRVETIPVNRDIIATHIDSLIESQASFAKNIEVFGSYDNIHWEFVQSDTLYSVDGKHNMGITFAKPQKYTHYRFKLANNLERISFSRMSLNYAEFGYVKSYFVENITPEFNVEEADKKTYVHVKGLKNVRLAEVTIDTDSMFKRNVTATPYGVNSELYNLSFNDISYTDTTIIFDRNIVRDGTLLLTISNGDDKPINIKGITVKYYADELVFEGKASTGYTLYFGADDTKTAPVYDISKYKDEVLKGDIDRLEIKEISFGVPSEKPTHYDYKWIFNIVVVVIAVILGFLILLKLRKKI